MPITEVPPSPSSSSSPPEPSLGKKRARYEALDSEELFHVIDDLEGSKTRGRIREFFWISIIFHMLLFWYLAYGPRYFHHVRVVDQSELLKQRDKQFTYLDTPETLKTLKQKEPKTPSDHPVETKTPRIDRKTLEEMRKAEPPAPQPQTPAPQVAQTPAPPPPAQPVPTNQQALAEAPKPSPQPAPTKPNFNTDSSTPGEEIRDAARAAAKSQPTFGGSSGGAGSPNGPGSAGGAEILSDTMGVDFGPYMKRIIYDTERAWWPIIPDIARPPLNKQGKVMIRFKIMKDGSVKEMILEGPSGDVSLDRAAWGGILGASPFPQLPKDFKGPYLELRFFFLYNIKPNAD
jgi:TonB family protein